MTTPAIQYAVLDVEMKALLESAMATGGAAAQADLDAVEASVIVDLGNVRTGVIAALTAIAVVATALNTLAAKINGSTVSGLAQDYATNGATNQVAASSPAAITTA